MPLPFGQKLNFLKNDKEAQGSAESIGSFICPQCMAQLSNAKELQAHFDTLHDDASNDYEDIFSMRKELSDLRSALKEEKNFSTELQKQIEALQQKLISTTTAAAAPKDATDNNSIVEVAYYLQQIQMLEAGKTLVTNQMRDTENSLNEKERQLEVAKRENASILEKSASISKQNADLSAQLDEATAKNVALEENVRTLQIKMEELEEQLSARPTEDDTEVLRKELVNAQTLMNQLTCDRESEAAKLKIQNLDLEEQCQKSNKELKMLRAEIKDLIPFKEEVEKMKMSFKETEFQHKKSLDEIKNQLTLKTSENETLAGKFKCLQDKLASSENLLSSANEKMTDVEKILYSTKTNLESQSSKLNDLETQVQKLRAEKLQLSQEKNEILSNLRSDESLTLVLQQLQDEKEQLQTKLDSTEKLLLVKQRSLEAALEKLENDLKQANQTVDMLTGVNRELKSKLADQLKLLTDSKSNHKNEMEECVLKFEAKTDVIRSEHANEIKRLVDECEALKTVNQQLDNYATLEKTVKELEAECLRLQEQLRLSIQNSKQESGELNNLINDLERKVEDLEFERLQLENREDDILKMNEALHLQISEIQKQENAQKDQVGILSFDVASKQSIIDSLNTKLTQYDEDFKASLDDKNKTSILIGDLHKQCDELLEETKKLAEQLNFEKASKIDVEKRCFDEMNFLKKEIDSNQKRALDTDILINETVEKIKGIETENARLRLNVEQEHTALVNLDAIKCQLENLNKDTAIRNGQLESEIRCLHEDKSTLQQICDKLQARLDAADADLNKTLSDFKQYQLTSLSAKEELEQSIENLKRELAESEFSKMDLKSSYDLELNQFKIDSQKCQTKLTCCQSDCNKLQAELELNKKELRHSNQAKQDLEAQLSAWNDEKRVLLDKCFNLEKYLDEEKDNERELNRRLDDAVSALRDLGREHQSMQIDISRHFNRKWADDSQVAECTTCNKQFTVTVRKHHCRHCGLIFCNECSSKASHVAASKRPVRVCDACFNALSCH